MGLRPRLDLLRKGGWCYDQESWQTFSTGRGAWLQESLLQPGRERFDHFVAWPMFIPSSCSVITKLLLMSFVWCRCSVQVCVLREGRLFVLEREGSPEKEESCMEHGPPEHSGKVLNAPEASKLGTFTAFRFFHSIYVYNGLRWWLRW